MPTLGLLKRKEIWVPTLRGWALLTILALLLAGVAIFETVPFLAPTWPLHGSILVVEGWLPDNALAEAAKNFSSHPYRVLVTTGVPIEQGLFITKETNYAQLAATTLQHLGVKRESLVLLASPTVPRNRTYATARQVQHWLDQQPPVDAVDVFTLGVHARRTWLLYQMALGSQRRVGIIAGNEERFDRRLWWTTSSGVRTVLSEAIAYVYAKLLFFPSSAEAHEPIPP